MALNDVYEITDIQTLRGQEVVNVYHYHQVLAFVPLFPTTAMVLAAEWMTQVLPAIREIQAGELVHTFLRVKNLFNAADSYEEAISLPGTWSLGADQDTMPTFNALAFQLNGDNAAVKDGSKRFAGLPETFANDGIVEGLASINYSNALSLALEKSVTVGLVIEDPVFTPVIVKRVRSGSPGNYTYRLPENQLESVLSAVIVAVWNALITSQISRKIGVGQ
jgi:hypothetical protein